MIEKESGIPLVGWEFKNHNANAIRGDIYQKDGTINQKKVSRYNTMSNTGKVLGVIPLVGAVVGVARIITTVTDDKQLYGNSYWKKAGFIARGATEIIGFGILWGVADAVSSLFSNKSERKLVEGNEDDLGQEDFFVNNGRQSVAYPAVPAHDVIGDDEFEYNEPPANNVNPSAVAGVRVEGSRLSVANRDALTSAILDPRNNRLDPKNVEHRDEWAIFQPFDKLPIQGMNIYLGNDKLRENLVNNPKASLRTINQAFSSFLATLGTSLKRPLDKLPNLIISVNSSGSGDQAGDGAAPDEIKTPGITHLRYPIMEGTKEQYEEKLQSEELQGVFAEMDQAINEGKSIYIHCNQGEHRSATILALYLYSRTGVTFEQAHRFIFNSRPVIKSLEKANGRDTLMTVAKELTDKKLL